jgi:predicted transcriptional regulator
MGQNEDMPRETHPPAKDWTPEAEMAMATFGNRTRNDMIRYLLEHGPQPRGEIVANVDASDASVAKHLVLLEEAGVIGADVEPGRRHGRAPRYSVNPDRIRVLLEAQLHYLTAPKQ